MRSARSRSSTSSPTASEIRAPVPYSSSSSARSRSASGVPVVRRRRRAAARRPRRVIALGSRRGGAGGRTSRATSAADQPVAQREAVQAAHRDHRPGGRGRRQRRVVGVARRAGAARNAADVAASTSASDVDAAPRRGTRGSAEVAAVGRERVGRRRRARRPGGRGSRAPPAPASSRLAWRGVRSPVSGSRPAAGHGASAGRSPRQPVARAAAAASTPATAARVGDARRPARRATASSSGTAVDGHGRPPRARPRSRPARRPRQPAGEEDPDRLVGEARRGVAGRAARASVGREVGLLGQLALRAPPAAARRRRRAARRAAPSRAPTGCRYWLTSTTRLVVVQGDHADRARVVDDLALGDAAVAASARASTRTEITRPANTCSVSTTAYSSLIEVASAAPLGTRGRRARRLGPVPVGRCSPSHRRGSRTGSRSASLYSSAAPTSAAEQRVRPGRPRLQLRVRLGGDEERVHVARQLDELDQPAVRRGAGDHQAGLARAASR